MMMETTGMLRRMRTARNNGNDNKETTTAGTTKETRMGMTVGTRTGTIAGTRAGTMMRVRTPRYKDTGRQQCEDEDEDATSKGTRRHRHKQQ